MSPIKTLCGICGNNDFCGGTDLCGQSIVIPTLKEATDYLNYRGTIQLTVREIIEKTETKEVDMFLVSPSSI